MPSLQVFNLPDLPNLLSITLEKGAMDRLMWFEVHNLTKLETINFHEGSFPMIEYIQLTSDSYFSRQ